MGLEQLFTLITEQVTTIWHSLLSGDPKTVAGVFIGLLTSISLK